LLSTKQQSSLRALKLAIRFKDKNVVRLGGLIYVATITLEDEEPGNHTLATPRTMRRWVLPGCEAMRVGSSRS
jgi:hypothetical protein